MSVLTKAQIVKAEENAVNNGTFSFRDLMYIAGSSAAKIIVEKYAVRNKKVAILCGRGNNSGDGCVIANYLKEVGADVTVITPYGEPVTENAKHYYNQLKTAVSDILNDKFDIIIDALFGIGFNGEIDSKTADIIENSNKQNAIRIAVDVPSGVECDTGRVNGIAFKADLTLTFIALKPCFVLPLGNDYCGEVKVIEIGVDITDKSYEIIKKPIFKERARNSHKGTFGTALLICGSYGMAGALMMSAKGALRSGLGIAKCIMPKSIYEPFTGFLPEAVCIPLKQNKNGTVKYSEKILIKNICDCNAVLFGCGIGKSKDNIKILKLLINSNKPLVIDADGINILVGRIELLKQAKAPIIITPHTGEMARLCGTTAAKIEANRPQYAKSVALKYGCTVILKGANTIIADREGKQYFNILGNSGLATGGSGDVLAGITVSYLAQGYSPEDAAKMAVYCHSHAADKAAEKRSRHALLPTDIIEEL